MGAIRSAKVLLAQKLDDNEITNAEYARQTGALDSRLDEIRIGVVKGMMDTGRQQMATELTEREANTQFDRLAREFPVTQLLSPSAFRKFTGEAAKQLAGQGVTLTPDAKGTLPTNQRLAVARIVAPMAQEKYGPLLNVGTKAGAAGAAAAAAAAETGKGTTAIPKKTDLPPDLSGAGEVKLGVVEGGLSEKSVLDLLQSGDEAGLETLIRENPEAAERYAIGG